MKKYLLSLITLTFFLCEASFTGGGMAFAADFGTNLTYTISSNTLTISVKSGYTTGSMPYWTSSNYTNATTGRPWESRKTNITTVIINKGVKNIGSYAFNGFTALATVKFGTSTTDTCSIDSIGTAAFTACSAVANVYCWESNGTRALAHWLSIGMANTTSNPFCASTAATKKFYLQSSNTTTISIPSGTTKVKPYAFYKTPATTIKFPSSVKYIGTYAVASSTTLASVYFGTGSTDLCGVDTIMGYVFTGCTAIANVYCYGGIGKYLAIGMNSSSSNPFYASTAATKKFYLDGTSTTTITIPEGITEIKKYAFYKHSYLTKISLPSTVSSVGTYAFAYCTGLTDFVALPATPPSTTSYTFNNTTISSVNLYVASAAAATAYGTAGRWEDFATRSTTFEDECGASGDNITFVLNFADHSLTLTGSGAMATYSTSTKAPWYTFKDDIHTISIGSGITGIGAYAFKDCANVTSASIPASITSIGSSAFDGCKAMTSYSYAGTIAQWLGITFGSSSSNPMCNVKKCYANGSTEVNNLVIPDGITTIGNYAFYQCSGLTSVTLPASLTTVNNNAFATCTNIANTNFLGTIDQWCSISFNSTACNPAFFSKQLSINGIEQTDIYLSDELTEIKNYTFYDNAALTSISVKNTTTIRPNALTNCAADIVVRGELSADFGTGLHWSLLDGVLTISGEGAMPITYATGSAPWYPYRNSINKIIVEEGITRIGKYCFEKITNTCGVFLPESLTNIDNYAFYGSTGIAYIVSKNTTPPAIPAVQYGGQYSYASHTFYNVPTTSAIYVPSGSESDYASAVTTGYNTSDGWKRFSNFLPYTGTCGATGNEANVIWLFDPGTGALTISGTGAMADFANSTSMPWNNFKTSITSVVIESGVTNIGQYSFNGCSGLTSITIPASVTTFNTLSFSGCNGLTTVNFLGTANQWASCTFGSTTGNPAYYARSLYLNGALMTECTISVPVSSNAFNYNTSLTSVTLANGCTSVGSSAFSSCSNLSSLTISPSVTSFAGSAFSSCTKLDKAQDGSVNYLGSADQWAAIDFSGSSANPAYYSKSLKLNGSTLTNCTISVDIKPYTFYRNLDLVSLALGANTKVVGGSAFYSCSALETITCTASSPLDSIAGSAFYDCTALREITFPASLRKVMGSAFSNDNALLASAGGSVDFLGTADQWASIDFASNTANPANLAQSLKLNGVTLENCTISVPVKENTFYNNKSLTSLTLNSGCTSIASGAFEDCSNIAGTLTIPSTMTAIGSSAFRECTSLTGLDLSAANSLQTIGASAFWLDAAIEGDLYIPATVTSVGGGAFNTMSKITAIYAMPATVPTGANQYTFGGFDTSIPFYVTSSAAASNYKAAQYWQDFTNVYYFGYCGAEDGGLNLRWTYNPTSHILTISGTGAMANYATASAMPWNSFKTSITSLVIEDGVTTIGDRAFYGCTALASVTFPETFNTLGNYAFYNCSGLTSIALPEGITAIGNSAFYGCTSLASVTLPSTLTSIGSNAFINDALTSIIIPSSVTSIGSGAFKGNAALVSVGLAEAPQLTTIGNSAFENCSSLTSITIPNKVTSIGNSSFSGCSLLATVNYGDTPTLATIGYSAFKNCSSLTSITIPESVTTITGNSNQNVYTPFAGCTSLTTVIWNARNCSGWTPINYMSSTYYQMPFESIKTQITSFTFGSNVQSIPQYLCHGMTGLESITIPASVTTIGANAFEGCTNIATVTSNATSVPPIASSTFPTAVEDAATLYVPATVAVRTAYSNDTYWSEFDHMLPYLLTFNLQEHGDAIDPICVNAGRVDEILKPADPTETGYTFGGWYSNEGCTTPFTFGESGTVVNADKTIYAKWTINSYDVTFDLQGHGDPIAPQSIDYNGTVTEPSPAPSEENYTFGGWFKEAGCDNAWDFDEDRITAATTLYAKWTLNGLALNEGADNSSAISAYDDQTTNVSITRSKLTNESYNTFCLPFALSDAQLQEIFGAGYDLREFESSSLDGEVLNLVFSDPLNALEAGKPYLLKPANEVTNPSFEGVTIAATSPVDNTSDANIEFHGVYSPTELAGGNKNLLFLGAGNELFWPESTGNIKGFRAYFVVKGSAAKAAKRARIVKKEDTATGIETITNDQSPITNKIIKDNQLLIIRDGKTYNAQGMRVE